MKVSRGLVDIHLRSIYPAIININDGLIECVQRTEPGPEICIVSG
jgi:hypothetical protein